MSVSKIAYRYGKSLLDLAIDQNALEPVVADIHLLEEALKVKEFCYLVQSPIVKADKKKSIFAAVFGGKIHDLTAKYFDVIISKGREELLPVIAAAFIDQYKKLQRISTVTLTTAQPVDASALKIIEQKLLDSKMTDQNVELDVRVDPSLIGGFVLDLDDMQYDGSVKKKLADLKQSFANK